MTTAIVRDATVAVRPGARWVTVMWLMLISCCLLILQARSLSWPPAALNVADIFHQQRRLWVRLHEKGGKFHEMPCHHTLEGYLTEYIERARLGEVGRVPLFQTIKHRPYGRGQAELTGERLHRINAWQMVRRRAKAADITTEVCNHTFRGTGITAYLENGGTLEKARQMAAHASTRTTQLYDRREDRVTLDEVVKINIRGLIKLAPIWPAPPRISGVETTRAVERSSDCAPVAGSTLKQAQDNTNVIFMSVTISLARRQQNRCSQALSQCSAAM